MMVSYPDLSCRVVRGSAATVQEDALLKGDQAPRQTCFAFSCLPFLAMLVAVTTIGLMMAPTMTTTMAKVMRPVRMLVQLLVLVAASVAVAVAVAVVLM